MNRRKFIQQAGMTSALAFISPSILSSCTAQAKGVATEAGLQLYTLRAVSRPFSLNPSIKSKNGK
jgi:hypothetical protein